MSRHIILVTLWTVTPSWASAGEAVIDPDEVVRVSIERNPQIAAAMQDAARARILETAEEHRYGFVLGMDASIRGGSTPALGSSGVTTPSATQVGLGVELRKPFSLGTELSLRLDGSLEKSETELGGASFNVGPAYGASLRLGLTQPLWKGLGRDIGEASLDAARASRSAAFAERDGVAIQALFDSLSAYWELFYATKALEIQRTSLELARSRREEASVAVRTGGRAPADLWSFETQVASIEEEVAAFEAEVERRSIELSRLLGDAAGVRRVLSKTATVTPPAGIPGSALEDAMATSTEIARARAALELAEISARTASQPYEPRLDLTAWVQASGLGDRDVGATFEQLGGLGGTSAFVGISFEEAVDSTQREAERQRAGLAVEAARLRVAAAEQTVRAQLGNVLTRDASARKRLELSERTLHFARLQAKAENERFRTGTSTPLSVHEAENQVRGAELRKVRASVDVVEAGLSADLLRGELLRLFSRNVVASR